MEAKYDKWAFEIGTTYLNVLTRPTYGVNIIQELTLLTDEQVYPLLRAIIEKDENQYRFDVNWNRKAVIVDVLPIGENTRTDFLAMEHCRYRKSFLRQKPEKVRKAALILAKKLGMRAIMDVMKQ